MASPQEQEGEMQSFLATMNTRMRDLDEKNRILRDRILLLGKNVISAREETEADLREIKKENAMLKNELYELKRVVTSLLEQSTNTVKKEELGIIQRMLQDFQPLDFMRREDVEKMIKKT